MFLGFACKMQIFLVVLYFTISLRIHAYLYIHTSEDLLSCILLGIDILNLLGSEETTVATHTQLLTTTPLSFPHSLFATFVF